MSQAKVAVPYRISVEAIKDYPGLYEVSFLFRCPNCNQIHDMVERDGMPLLYSVGWQLACGWVDVRFPWYVGESI